MLGQEPVHQSGHRLARRSIDGLGEMRGHGRWREIELDAVAGDKIDSAVVRAGVGPEGQKFQPHVTLARSKGEPVPKLGEFLVQHNLFRSQPFEVTHFTLFSSFLGHNAPIYMPERSYELSRELSRA